HQAPGTQTIMTIATSLSPILLLANAGTALMWVGFLHLTIGNVFIALLEGALLHRFAKVAFGRAFLWMLGANFFSTLIGSMITGTLVGLIAEEGIIWQLRNAAWVTWSAYIAY